MKTCEHARNHQCNGSRLDKHVLDSGLLGIAGRVEGRIQNGFREYIGNENYRHIRANDSRHDERSRKEEGLILAGCMQAQVGSAVQMPIFID